MTLYFNAAAVPYFKLPGQLPGAAGVLDGAVRHRVAVVLGAVLLFVLLHELGHVDFDWRADARSSLPQLVSEFAVPGEYDEAKREKLYADAYAVSSVPEGFALPLAHAATFFLHLRNYVDATGPAVPSAHPLCVNRIAMLHAVVAKQESPHAVGQRTISWAVETGSTMLSQRSPHFSLEDLQRYTEPLSRVDWKPAQEALQALPALD